MTTNRTPRSAARSPRTGRWLRLFRPAAPLAGLLDGDRDAQRQLADLRAARAHQVPEG